MSETSKIRDDVNEYGTPVSVHKCQTCGVEFTLCPVIPDDEAHQWPDCMADNCASYDPERDAEVLFMSDAELAAEKKVISMDKLRQRAAVQKHGPEILKDVNK